MDKLRRKLSGRLALVLVFAMTITGTPVYADRGDVLSAYDDLGEYNDIISETEGDEILSDEEERDIVPEDASDPVIEDGFPAKEGVGDDGDDGYAGQGIIASYLHDQDNRLSDNELYKSGSYRVTREISGNTIVTGASTVNVTVYAEDLRRHAAAFSGDNRHYWAGLGVPCDYDGWSVKYLQTEDPDRLGRLSNYVSLPDGTQTEDGVAYANFYYRTDDIAGTGEKRYLGVAYEKESGLDTIRSIIVYVLDFSNVTLDTGFPGAGDFVDGIKEAALSDNIAEPAKKKKPVIEDYHAEARVSGNNTVNISLTGRNLKKYQNHSGEQDYWLGVDIPKLTLAEGQAVKFYESYTDPGTSAVDFEPFNGVESEEYRTFYFKKEKDIKTAYKYYILARYSNSDQESEVIRYVVDASSVTFADELPAIGDISSVVNAPLVDRSAVPEESLYDGRSYSVEAGTPDTEHNIIPVNISADGLKVHKAGNGVSGNWVGFGIPEINDANVSANYCQSYTEIDDPAAIGAGDWKSVLDDVLKDENEKISHRTVYFNAGDSRLVDKTGYVYVKYTSLRDENDYVIYTFVVDMNGVTLYGLPAEGNVAGEIITSPLHDNKTGTGALSDNELYDEGTYKLAVGEKDQDGYYPVTVSAKNLRSHLNSAGTNAYWLGVSLPYIATAGLKTEYSFRKSDGSWGDYHVLNESDFDHIVPQESGPGRKYCGFYFDGKKYSSKDFCFAIRYTLNGSVQTYKFKVNTSGVTFNDGLPEITASDVTAAPLVDQNDPGRSLVSDYAVSARDTADAIDVTVTGKGLLKHLAGGSAGLGYWAGIGIRVNEAKNYTAEYYQSYEEVDDPENISGWKPGLDNVLKDENENVTHRTVYFNAADSRLTDKTGYVYVKYSSDRYVGDVKIITFRINFSGLGLAMANGANDIMEAELRDDTSNPIPAAKLVYPGSYKAELTSASDVIGAGDDIVIPVKVKATDLVQHTVSGKGVGYWAGIALPASFDSALGSSGEVGYYSGLAPVNEDTQFKALDSVYDGEQTVEGRKYNRFLLDVTGLAGKTGKGYVAVRFTDGTAKATVTYVLDFSWVTLRKPAYELTLEEDFTGDAGRLNPAGTGLTINLTAHVSDNRTPVSGCAVAWESSNPEVAAVAGSSNTDKDGKTTATVTFATGEVKPGVAVITASISGTKLASVRYETYGYNDVNENVTLRLPGDSVYALTPTYELADGSAYAIIWDNDEDDPDVVAVDNDGFVTAINNGDASLSQRIADPASGKTVDRFGETDSEERKLETPKGEGSKYKIKVKSQLSSIAVRPAEGLKIYARQANEDVGSDRTKVDNALFLEISPATYKLQGDAGTDYKIEWNSSNENVATVSGADLTTASVTGLKKGVTNITATVKILSENKVTQTVRATYALKVYPSVKGIEIFKQGTGKPASSFDVKKGASIKLIADVTAEDTTVDRSVMWSSDNVGIAKVNDSGLVTAVSKGIARITAETPDGVSKTVIIEVYENITAIRVDMANVVLNPGEQISVNVITAPVDAKVSLNWKTASDKVASVTPDKSVPGKAVIAAADGKTSGNTTITVTDSLTGLSATVRITIGGTGKELSELKADVTEYSLYPGNTVKLAYKAVPSDYTNTVLEWSSDNESVAMVDINGLVTAVGVGDATVTLKGGDVELNYAITVKQAPDVSSIAIEPKTLTLTAPAGGAIEAGKALISVARYPEFSDLSANIVYELDNEEIATIESVAGDNSRAVVIARKAGSTRITAYCYKGSDKEIKQSIPLTVTEAVEDRDIATNRYNAEGPWIGFVDEYVYTGSAVKPEPNVYYGSLKLTAGRDYTCSYSNNVNAARSKNAPTVTVKLKGNYKGSLSQTFVINPADIAENVTVNKVSGVIKYKDGYPADQLLKPVITYNSKTLKEDRDYQLYYLEDVDGAYQKAGEWTITVVGQGNFTGETYTEEILMTNGTSIKNVKASFAKSYVYTGKPIEPKVSVTLGGSSLKEDEDYVITFNNNEKVGKATATVTGTGRYYGSKTFTFKIVPEVIKLDATTDDKLVVTVNDTEVAVNGGSEKMDEKIPYSKGGTRPSSLTVTYDGIELTEGVDYKWSNRVTLKQGTGKITITGKNKKNLPRAFSGKAVITYEIGLKDISTLTFVVDDFVYRNKEDAYKKNKITVYDLDGKALKKNKDYAIAFETDDGGSIPTVGTYVTATITGKGFYDPNTSATVSFRIISKDQKLSNASLYGFMDDDGEEFKSSKYYVKYTGVPVTLEEQNIILKLKKKVGHSYNKVRIDPDQYEIVTIRNNNKVGKATVVLHGIGDMGGLKTITFKIKK